jgi:hypothetical protein
MGSAGFQPVLAGILPALVGFKWDPHRTRAGQDIGRDADISRLEAGAPLFLC